MAAFVRLGELVLVKRTNSPQQVELVAQVVRIISGPSVAIVNATPLSANARIRLTHLVLA